MLGTLHNWDEGVDAPSQAELPQLVPDLVVACSAGSRTYYHNTMPTWLLHDPHCCLQCIQLYEMIVVRHGLMIVGLPFAGKTVSYR